LGIAKKTAGEINQEKTKRKKKQLKVEPAQKTKKKTKVRVVRKRAGQCQPIK